MRNFYNIIITFFFLSQLSFSQQMPIDFSETSDNFVTFGGTSFSIITDPIDSGNDVGRIVNTGGIWEGAYLNLSRPIDLDFQKTITLSFYSYNSNNHNIVLKLENGGNADVEVIKNVSSVGWTHTIKFDFSNAVYSGSSTSVNASGTYSTITVFVDGGNTTTGTYLIDNIDDGSTPVVSPPDPVYDYLVWSDEFDGTGNINTSNWFHQTLGPNGGVWFNGEQQHYTDRTVNSYVDSGFLNIVAIKENYQPVGAPSLPYTSARLNSKFAFTYGKVEVRAKLPFGSGTWPAIWMLGKNIIESGAYWETQGFGSTPWPACGEIDIMEHWGTNQNYVQSAMHTPSSYGGTVNLGGQTIPTVSTAFHDYVLEWYEDKMVFSVDGNVHYTYQPAVRNSNTWPFFEDQYLILNVAIQESIDPSITQSAMVIDYVRIYQASSSLSNKDNVIADLKIFPNPCNTIINLTSKSIIDKVELYDIMGKQILKKVKNTEIININSLNSGIYILKIYSGNQKAIKKVVIN